MDVLQLVTAGSVDDGKSTLIGRLLYETRSLKADQLEHIESKSKALGYDYLDFSLATDGLLTEREQGITIDISHIYCQLKNRRLVIADAPGHEEYTRNMVTGASNASLAILLIDARKGVLEQTKRHLYITQLMGISQLIFAVNKMDLIDYDEHVFAEIREALLSLIKDPSGLELSFVPLSALEGENIAEPSTQMPWYEGPSLLQLLEDTNPQEKQSSKNAFEVQYVIRPKRHQQHDYRGFAGKVCSGSLSVGDPVWVLPSGTKTSIEKIERYETQVDTIQAPQNATLLLKDEVDSSRGGIIVLEDPSGEPSKNLKAKVCWMQKDALRSNTRYWIQLGVQKVQAKIGTINSRVDLESWDETSASALELNDIGEVDIRTAQPLFFEPYKTNPKLGAFILIDPQTNNTAGVGFIQ